MKLLRTLAILVLSSAIAAPALARAQSSGAPAIEQVRQRGVLRAGLSTFVPWAMRDRQGGLIGFELDVGNRLAQA